MVKQEIRKQPHQAEEILNQQLVRTIIDGSSDIIVAVDNNRKIIEFNGAAQKAFGYSREEVLGRVVNMLYADSEHGVNVHRAALELGKLQSEIRNKRKNGEEFRSLLSAQVLRNAAGIVVGTIGISREISDPKLLEQETILQALGAVVWRMRLSSMSYTYVGGGAEDILGYPTEQWMHEEGFWKNHIHPDDLEAFVRVFESSVRDKTDFSHDYRLVSASNTVVRVRTTACPLTAFPGELAGLTVDITQDRS